VKTFYQSESSISITFRKLKAKFGKTKVLTNKSIYNLVNAFEPFSSVADIPKFG